MTTYDFSGLTIPSPFGNDRISVGGELSSEEIGERLIEEWIPYLECHECGRHTYCRYAEPLPDSHGRYKEIRCGVAADAIRNFVAATFPLIGEASEDQLQAYLDGTYHFCRFVSESETAIGGFISRGFVEFLGEMAPAFFGHITDVREHLNKFSYYLSAIPEIASSRGVVFLEGYSEQAFVARLAQSGLWPYTELITEVYEGKGNIRPKRIKTLLTRYVRDGYKIFIQTDADGSNVETIAIEESIEISGTFIFRYDFESSLPPALLHEALQLLDVDLEIPYSDFEKTLANFSGSTIEFLQEQCNIDIEPIKVDLASTVGGLLAHPYSNWFQSEDFWECELGRFVRFLDRAYR
jgi:hypothetical protein